jgi:hypothetical protein
MKVQPMRGQTEHLAVLVGILVSSACSPRETVFRGFGDDAMNLRVINREAASIQDRKGAVRLSSAPGNGVAWVEGTHFRSGTIEVEIRGRETVGQHYVGVAFHRRDDNTYEAVYARPFNFRATDPVRKQHAIQYIMLPEFDWPRLREEFPEEFENPVDASIVPTDWVKLRVVVARSQVQIYVSATDRPAGYRAALEVRKLGQLDGGNVGLWVGNDSGGDFANLVIRPAE